MNATLADLFLDVCQRRAHHPALLHRVNGHYTAITWQQCRSMAESLANWFIDADLAVGERVGLLCETRYEWFAADMAMHLAGLVNVPLYPTATSPQVAYILRDCGAKALIVSSRKQLDKALGIAADCPDLQYILVIDDVAVPPADMPVWRWSAVMTASPGAGSDMALHRADRYGSIDASSLCSIIYTSGTTGEPKGVMLSHRNILSNVDAVLSRLDASPRDIALSFLPLSHVLERLSHYAMLAAGGTIAYAGGLESLMTDLRDVQPTVLTVVPRVLEKIHDDLLADMARRGAWEDKLLPWALKIGHTRHVVGKLPPAGYPVADRFVLEPIRRRFGGRLRRIFCGGAPLDAGLGAFFSSAGVPVYEGYGLTETSPVISLNYAGNTRLGTVGRVLPDVTVRLAEDGEICVKGPNVMMGYYQRSAATEEIFDAAGWLHTGDLGEFDAEGYLHITGRKKEIIVLSNGKKVTPGLIESQLQASPYIQQALVVGDNRHYLVALLVPHTGALADWAGTQGLDATSPQFLQHADVLALLRQETERVTADLARFEQIKRFALVDGPWNLESGDLTPTLKYRRSVIEDKHLETIETLYDAEPLSA